MHSAIYQPRGKWGAPLDLTASELLQLKTDPSVDSAPICKPDLVKRLPSFPSGRPKNFPFYRPLIFSKENPELNGTPKPFMRAHSPIDQKSGVYLIWDAKSRQMYVGSSIGNSRQGNVRLTMMRHWQNWNRYRQLSDYVSKFKGKGSLMRNNFPEYKYKGGITINRSNHIYICVMTIENNDKHFLGKYAGSNTNRYAPRQLEAWYYDNMCSKLHCIGINQIAHDEPDRQLDNVPF